MEIFYFLAFVSSCGTGFNSLWYSSSINTFIFCLLADLETKISKKWNSKYFHKTNLQLYTFITLGYSK